MIEWIKNKVGLWFPLSLTVFIAYAIQRGGLAVSKTGMVPEWFGGGLRIYFLTISVTMLFCGILMDNVRSKSAMIVATILGSIGLLATAYAPLMSQSLTPWVFGICMGVAATLIKIIPFSSPMKIYDKDEAIKVAPQASAKNFGAGAFVFLLPIIIAAMSWTGIAVGLSLIFLLSGVLVYLIMPDDRIVGWNISIFPKLFKDWQFWTIMSYFFIMVGFFYRILPKFMPAMVAAGIPDAGLLLAISFVLAGVLRWPFAGIGKEIGHWNITFIGLALMIFSVVMIPIDPVLALFTFTIGGATHTPNYWAGCKQIWGKEYIATVLGLGYTFMYLGGGVLMGKW